MKTIYTNQGSFFGYIDKNYLFTYKGICVGKLQNDEIYSPNGMYLGEISKLNYLVKNISKKNQSIEKWEATNGKEIPMQGFQFGRLGVSSIIYTDFNEPEDFH